MNRRTLLICFIILLIGMFYWMGRRPERTIIFQISDEFRGLFAVVEVPGQSKLSFDDQGVCHITVPENGVVTVNDLSIFEDWHQAKCMRMNGDEIPYVVPESGLQFAKHSLLNVGTFHDAQQHYALYLITDSPQEYEYVFKHRPYLCLAIRHQEQPTKQMLPFYFHNRDPDSGVRSCQCPTLIKEVE